ncbi:MAG TPA: DUF308 domain-containing protein, partial [Micromonosporaceae bacterium]
GNHGVAAYLQPTSDQHPYLRETSLPSRPTDRLYVDRSEVDTAREFLEILKTDTEATSAPAARTGNDDFEAAWASIVAGFDKGADPENAPWPSVEDVPDGGSAAPAVTVSTDYPRWTPATQPEGGSLLDGLDGLGRDLPDDDDDTYHPPTPPPLPRLASITIVAILGIIIGIALMIDPELLPIDPTLSALLGGTCVVAGGIALIGRLRSGRDDTEDDDPDNGAVV